MSRPLHSALVAVGCSLVAFSPILIATAQSDRSGALTVPSNRPGSLAILLGVHLIQEDLGLSDRQKSAANSVRNAYREAARRIVSNTGASPKEKEMGHLKLEALTTQYNVKALDILTTEQRQRLTQIEHQVLGGYALLSKPLQQELQLTNEQKSKIQAIYDDSKAKVSKVNLRYQEGKISNETRLRELRSDRLDRQERMLQVLTPEQLKAFKLLGGETFNE